MLTLSRREGEKVVIMDGQSRITVTIVSVEPGKVRLGITAPPGVPVDREEIHEAKKAAGRIVPTRRKGERDG